MLVINKIGEWLIEGQRWGSNFNMYAPASGCTSDLRGRSYDPLSTDDAAASYHDQGSGSPILLFHLVQPSRPSRCCRLFKQRRCLDVSVAITFYFLHIDLCFFMLCDDTLSCGSLKIQTSICILYRGDLRCQIKQLFLSELILP